MVKRVVTVSVAMLLALVVPMAGEAGGAPPDRENLIVVLKPGTDPGAVANEHARGHQGEIRHVYRNALSGYAGSFPPGRARSLENDPRVDYVEPDGEVTASTTQSNATWGLDRIDQRNLPLSTTFTYNKTGAGVTAYIIDTGIRFTHSQFGGRAVAGTDKVSPSTGGNDCNGHGTHVAGTVGGSTYGVAKAARLVAVRVLGCNGSGYTSGVIAGVDWVTGNHAAGTPAVANMSLGGGASSSLDTAVRNSILDGVSYSLAAGNSNTNACNSSPARVAEGMTIGASDKSDRRASFSNHGSCLDWFAPGVSITSAWYTSNTAAAILSGTSMAAPHTAGVAALYLQSNPTSTASAVRTALHNLTTKAKIKVASSTNNHLLFTNL